MVVESPCNLPPPASHLLKSTIPSAPSRLHLPCAVAGVGHKQVNMLPWSEMGRHAKTRERKWMVEEEPSTSSPPTVDPPTLRHPPSEPTPPPAPGYLPCAAGSLWHGPKQVDLQTWATGLNPGRK